MLLLGTIICFLRGMIRRQALTQRLCDEHARYQRYAETEIDQSRRRRGEAILRLEDVRESSKEEVHQAEYEGHVDRDNKEYWGAEEEFRGTS